MLLNIDDQLKVDAIQDTFNECFPHLKIEIFKSQRDYKNDNPVDGSWLLADVRSIHDRGILELKSWFNVEDVQQLFKKRFGMLVKIFRNEKDNWVLLQKNDLLSHPSPATRSKNISTGNNEDPEEIRLQFPSGKA